MSKLPNQLNNALKDLRSMKPDSAWHEATKQRLVAELSLEAVSSKSLSMRGVASTFTKEWLGRLAWQPIGALLVLIGLVIGPGFVTVNAAKGSLPGDALYPVKRSLERARITFAITNSKKAQLEVDLVANRLHELQRITKEQAPSLQRQQNIAIAIEELKKDTATVKTRLEAAVNAEPASSSQEAVALAKLIDQKTSDYQQTLQSAVAELDDASVQTNGADLGQALVTVQDVAINALDVLVNKGTESEQSLTMEELHTRVQSQLDAVKKASDAFRTRLVLQTQIETPVVLTAEPAVGTEALLVEETATAETAPDKTTVTPKEETPVEHEKTSEENPADVTAKEGESETVETPAAPTEEAPAEPEKPVILTVEELTKKLDEEITPLITMAEELLKLQDFSAALTTLDKANKQMDVLSQQLVARQESLKPVTPPDPEPAQQPDEGTASTPEPEQEGQTPSAEGQEPGSEPAAEPETKEGADLEKTPPPAEPGTATTQQ